MSRRGDLVPIALLALLATFVGVQVAGARASRADAAATLVESDERPADRSDVPPDSADRSYVLARLLADGPGTYIDAIVAVDSMLRRWPLDDRKPLRVWVPTSSSIMGWSAEQPDAVRGAFRAWEHELPVQFTFVEDSADAQVSVSWVSRLGGEQQVGNSSRSYDAAGRILHAHIALSVLGRDDRPLPAQTARIAALHEVGHVLGLEHSPDQRDVMVARYDGQAVGLSRADVATARLLYALPSGPLGRSAVRD